LSYLAAHLHDGKRCVLSPSVTLNVS